ncbi:MAG: hypothetical protein MJY61_02255 [Bacteroidales bacterium]|nr:hypothetical protein [Bacteroidales bacterium]
MKKVLFPIAAALLLLSYRPAYGRERDNGYRGSVSFSNIVFVFCGVETSHGYMFDGHHYLGAGVGILTTPFTRPLAFLGSIFADYHAYWFDRKSTPTAGIKVGYMCSFPDTGNFQNLIIEPDIGWSWLLESGRGLTLTFGAFIVPEETRITETSSFPVTVIPCLRFGFEF